MATDYYALLARAVAGLVPNTGEARRVLYEAARAGLLAQLRAVMPPLSEGEITRERLALEEAIRRVEAEQQPLPGGPAAGSASTAPEAASAAASAQPFDTGFAPGRPAAAPQAAGSSRDTPSTPAALSLAEIEALRRRADARATPLPESITRSLERQMLDDLDDREELRMGSGATTKIRSAAIADSSPDPELARIDEPRMAQDWGSDRPSPGLAEDDPRIGPARPPPRWKSRLLLLSASTALFAAAGGYVFRSPIETRIEELIDARRPPATAQDPEALTTIAFPFLGMVVPPPGASPSPSVSAHMDVVDVSAFAPNEGRAGESVMVQVYLHRVRQFASVSDQAKKKDPGTSHRETATLATEIRRGESVAVELTCEGLFDGAKLRRLRWGGRPTVLSFPVNLPRACAGRSHTMEIRVLVGDIPIGYLAFVMPVRDGGQPIDAMARMQGTKSKRYRYAFMSYSSADRVEVLKNARLLQALNIDFFQDILSLRSGQEFEPELFSEIDKCDLFLLFWSQKAAESTWVMRETEYALTRQGANRDKEPEIKPIILESNPIPRPPKSLDHLHFNDFITHVIAAVEAASAHRGA